MLKHLSFIVISTEEISGEEYPISVIGKGAGRKETEADHESYGGDGPGHRHYQGVHCHEVRVCMETHPLWWQFHSRAFEVNSVYARSFILFRNKKAIDNEKEVERAQSELARLEDQTEISLANLLKVHK